MNPRERLEELLLDDDPLPVPQFDIGPLPAPRVFDYDWQPQLADVAAVAAEPFFASKRICYPELQQSYSLAPFQAYKFWSDDVEQVSTWEEKQPEQPPDSNDSTDNNWDFHQRYPRPSAAEQMKERKLYDYADIETAFRYAGEAAAGQKVLDDEPFFASNLIYYPDLPQPFTVGPYEPYRSWRDDGNAGSLQGQQEEQDKEPSKQELEDFFDLDGEAEFCRRFQALPGRFEDSYSFYVEPEQPLELPEEPPVEEPTTLPDEPFFANNLIYYPELHQALGADEFKSYRKGRENRLFSMRQEKDEPPKEPRKLKQMAAKRPEKPDIWQLLGKNVYSWTQQPNGQPLVPLDSLAQMSGLHVACVLLAAHLIQHRQDPNENCLLTHFNANELRSYVVVCDEVQDVLTRCEQRELGLRYSVPNLESPKPRDLPQPPSEWLYKPQASPSPAMLNLQLKEKFQPTDARGQENFIKPKLLLISEWQPETASYNYKLESH